MEGAVYAHNLVSTEFHERYAKHFGNDVQIAHAAIVYEFAILVGELFGRQPAASTSLDIVRMLKAVTNHKGTAVDGNYSFKIDTNGDSYFSFPLTIKRIEGDKINRVE